jgi:hypothetical protein
MRLLLFAVVLVGCACCWPPASGEPEAGPTTGDDGQQAPNDSELPPLFNFEMYQKLFDKHYDSPLEASTRRAYLLANAFKVYVAGVEYKHWTRPYYLALNEMSDWSPKELDMIENKMLVEESVSGSEAAQAEATGGQPTGGQVDLDEFARSLEQKIKEKLADREFQLKLKGDRRSERRKRAADEAEPDGAKPNRGGRRRRRRPRALDVHDLINHPRKRPARKASKLEGIPESNNPNYDWRQMEVETRGLIDQQQDVWFWIMDRSTANQVYSLPVAPYSFFADKFPNLDHKSGHNLVQNKVLADRDPGDEDLPDEMFVDLRTTNCLSEVRSQGKCGSCYAFASIAMMEYWYCRGHNLLPSFSEQYLVDCGKGRVKGMGGCRGGSFISGAQFIANFGLELREHMPYLAKENECPYSNDTDLQTTGFVRVDGDSMAVVKMNHWAERLKRGPIVVYFAFSMDLVQYKKGVYMGESCTEYNHAMMVIGHGREDGEEFWLLRNSHGSNWGDEGHLKVSKRAKFCFAGELGFVFATRDGSLFPKGRTNGLNKRVQQMYPQVMLPPPTAPAPPLPPPESFLREPLLPPPTHAPSQEPYPEQGNVPPQPAYHPHEYHPPQEPSSQQGYVPLQQPYRQPAQPPPQPAYHPQEYQPPQKHGHQPEYFQAPANWRPPLPWPQRPIWRPPQPWPQRPIWGAPQPWPRHPNRGPPLRRRGRPALHIILQQLSQAKQQQL